jgi:hypothetical protein
MRAVHRLGRHGSGDEDVDERRGDAVVESTLDVEDASDVGGHPLVLHDRGAERSVGRGHHGTDRGGDPESATGEEGGGDAEAGGDRERQAEAEKARRDGGVAPEGAHVHPAGVGEEDDGQRDLRHGADGRGVQIEVHEAGGSVRDEDPEDHEGDRGRDVPALQAGRDQTPEEHAGRDHREGDDAEVVVH